MTVASSRRNLLLGRLDQPPRLVAGIGDPCLARRGVVCQSCGDACGEGAIRFRPTLGRVPALAFDADRCTACGDCVEVCPVAAIALVEAGHGV